MRSLIYNIGLLASPKGKSAKAGVEQNNIDYIKDAWILCEDDRIADIGCGAVPDIVSEKIDAKGRLVTPALIDPHTHLVFASWREDELYKKINGVPYLEILRQGGGILSTVRKTRLASKDELKAKAKAVLSKMIELGICVVESKSGYGLNLEDEIKQLSVNMELDKEQPIKIVSTLMAAHALPEEYKDNRQSFLDLIVEKIIPKVKEEKLAEFCDVFCEEGVFSKEESLYVLSNAKEKGFGLKIHSDEIHSIGGTQIAEQLNATSAEHLIASDEKEIEQLARGNVIACLLPATSFYLNKPFAKARLMIEKGVPVAIGSDFNPGSCPSFNLHFCMNLSAYKYKLLPDEILTAVTLNAAAALNLAADYGSIEKGKKANILIWNAQNLEYLLYRFGENLVNTNIIDGTIVKSFN